MRPRTFLLVLGLGALGLRLLYLSEFRHSPFFDAPVVDARSFLEEAQAIAGGALEGKAEPFWQPPLYIYFLAALCRLFPEHYFAAIRLVQALLGTLSCMVLYFVARAAFDEGVARLAAMMAAAYSLFFYFEGELLGVTLEIFLNLLLLHLLQLALESRRGRTWILAGLTAGLAALTRPNILLFVAALLLWLIPSGRRRGSLAGTWARILVPAALLILPISARNYLFEPDFVLISANGGINFYLGNNAEYERSVAIHPGMKWEELIGEAERAGRISAAQRSDYFYGRAFSYIRAHPLDYLLLLGRKLYLFWSGPEAKRNLDIYYGRRHSLLLSLLLWDRILSFPFGLIAPLALVGLGLSRRHRPASLLRLYALSYMLSVVLFFVAARYRLPALPALLVFAALALRRLGAALRARRWGFLGRAGLPLLGLGVLLNLGAAPMSEQDAQLYGDLGEVHLRKAAYEQAAAYLRHALELEPHYNYARHNLAVAYFHQGRYAQALREGLRTLEENPKRPDTHLLLGRTYMARKEWKKAAHHLRRALELEPHSGMAHYYYGRLLHRLGHYSQALAQLEKARAWRPRDFWIRYELGRTCQQDGQLERALQHFEAARALEARPEVLNAIGALYFLRGEPGRARPYFEQALASAPHYLEAQINLGLLELEEGRLEEALARLEKARKAHPRSPVLLRALAAAYERAGRTHRAQALRRRRRELEP